MHHRQISATIKTCVDYWHLFFDMKTRNFVTVAAVEPEPQRTNELLRTHSRSCNVDDADLKANKQLFNNNPTAME